MNIKAFIFDLDGTLVDSGADLAHSINLMRSHYKLPHLPLPEIISYIGNGAPKLVERSIKDTNLDQEDALQTFINLYKDNICRETKFFPGVEDFLKELQKRNMPAVVLTNKPQAMTDKLLEEMNATDYFKLIYGPEAHGRKPDPNGLIQVLKELNINPQDAIMVGDHTTDLIAAEQAKVKSIFCPFGLGTKEGCSPDYEINSGKDLFKFL